MKKNIDRPSQAIFKHLEKRLENVPVNQVRTVITLLADNKSDEIRRLLPGSIGADLASMMELSAIGKFCHFY